MICPHCEFEFYKTNRVDFAIHVQKCKYTFVKSFENSLVACFINSDVVRPIGYKSKLVEIVENYEFKKSINASKLPEIKNI